MRQTSNAQMISKLYFRLLPIQILICVIGAVNGIVSSLFASNFVGAEAMGAVGLYGPISMLVGAISTMLVGGSQILCGKFMGKNQVLRTQKVFSLSIVAAVFVAAIITAVVVIFGAFDLTGSMTEDPEVRRIFNQYLLGQAIGILPLMLGNLSAAFLSLENNMRRATMASFVYIVVNVLLNYLFVVFLRLEAFGLALASSLGMWVYCVVQAQYFFTEKTKLRFTVKQLPWREAGEIVKIGMPGAISYGYQAIRGLIVNMLVVQFVGSVGIAAFATVNSFLGLFWAIPGGMSAVARMMMSVSVGEEDRQTLKDIMRVGLYKCVPIMLGIVMVIIACAVPITRFYYRDVSEYVYQMTVYGFRLLPLCMPLAVAYVFFLVNGQVFGKQAFVHVMSLLDGVVCVAGFTALLIGSMGINAVYTANILNGVVQVLGSVVYAWIVAKRFPRTMDELMAIPKDFGVGEGDRMDLSLDSMEEVVHISRDIRAFCRQKGIDEKRVYLAGLFMEEMAGNIVAHGFLKDKKKHTVDVRVVYKENDLILRLKDDCVPFDPAERQSVVDPKDVTKNVGIRMVYAMTDEIHYQNIFGLNVLTVRI